MSGIGKEKVMSKVKTRHDFPPYTYFLRYMILQILHRDLKNVLQDVAYLQELGIIEVTDKGIKRFLSFAMIRSLLKWRYKSGLCVMFQVQRNRTRIHEIGEASL